jgi:hypothetical protein
VAVDQGAQRTDPKAGSPAGVIYEIPLDSGRRDAAPVLHVGSRGSTTGAGAAEEGGDGAVSSQPGEASADSATEAQGTAGGNENAPAASQEGGGTPNNPSSIHSENGFGSASQVPGISPAALRTGAGVAAAGTPGSTLSTYLLIAIIAVAAIAAGLLTARGGRRDASGEGPSKGL